MKHAIAGKDEGNHDTVQQSKAKNSMGDLQVMQARHGDLLPRAVDCRRRTQRYRATSQYGVGGRDRGTEGLLDSQGPSILAPQTSNAEDPKCMQSPVEADKPAIRQQSNTLWG